MKLGKLIRLTREARGFTLRELDRRSGVSHGLISQVETGWVGDISLHKAKKLADALGLTLDQLAETKVSRATRRNAV